MLTHTEASKHSHTYILFVLFYLFIFIGYDTKGILLENPSLQLLKVAKKFELQHVTSLELGQRLILFDMFKIHKNDPTTSRKLEVFTQTSLSIEVSMPDTKESSKVTEKESMWSLQKHQCQYLIPSFSLNSNG